jgi:hypothetical protein
VLALPLGLLSGSLQAWSLSRSVAIDALPPMGVIAFALGGALALAAAASALHGVGRWWPGRSLGADAAPASVLADAAETERPPPPAPGSSSSSSPWSG